MKENDCIYERNQLTYHSSYTVAGPPPALRVIALIIRSDNADSNVITEGLFEEEAAPSRVGAKGVDI